MQQNDLIDVLVLEKRLYGKLNEVMELTVQLAEAVDRKDQISVQMLVAMRQEPIEHLRQTEENFEYKRASLTPEEQVLLGSLMAGDAGPEPYEQMVANQAATNRRLLDRVIELDRRVSQKLGGDDSYYVGGK